jgi:hypothetical protein
MSTAKFDTLSTLDGSQSVPVSTVAQGTARAWVNFNGTGTVAIRASFNVSSITDNGTGLYTVNFTVAMQDVNYASCCTGGLQSSSGTNSAFATSINKGTTTFQLATRSGSNVDQDQDSISVAVFR